MTPESAVQTFLEQLTRGEAYEGQIEHVAVLPARPARYGDPQMSLRPEVESILKTLGIERLYAHQTQAIEAINQGTNVVIAAGTAGGKTLCYMLPLTEQIYADPQTRALLIYPTKALAQDQLSKLQELGAGTVFSADTYDGDTPRSKRRRIKREAQVVLTNPDMLHVGVLPYHGTWADFFRHLKYVVLDEAHVYRGVFGSHTANVMRRLRRIAAHYGSQPQFVCSSATIGNPQQLAERLVGLDFKVVDEDGSPEGRRFFVLWNPPLIDKDLGQRRSGNMEAANLTRKLVERDIRTLTFTLARRQAELILQYIREQVDDKNMADRLMAYRGGYLPTERREIERRLFSGELLAVVATSALELGVDIGALDAVIMTGYPGSISSTWQQAGRAGRAQQDSLAVLIALSGGIHQYIMQHPEYLLETTRERALVNPHNRFILGSHLLCAAYELPLVDEDAELFGAEMTDILKILAEYGYVTKRQKWYWTGPDDTYPAGEISIRSSSGTGYEIVEAADERLIGTIDDNSAFWMTHPGAIYLHGGENYLVTDLDIQAKKVSVEPAEVDYYTQAVTLSKVEVVAIRDSRVMAGEGQLFLGELNVKSQVAGYRKRRRLTEQELGTVDLDLPAQNFETVGIWFPLSHQQAQTLTTTDHHILGSLHALEHALIGLLPLFALCDPHDIGGVSESYHPDVGAGGIFVYDGYPGGVGICEEAYYRAEELLAAVADRIENCPCEVGCPACVQSPSCGDNNQPLDKMGAALLARLWSG